MMAQPVPRELAPSEPVSDRLCLPCGHLHSDHYSTYDPKCGRIERCRRCIQRGGVCY